MVKTVCRIMWDLLSVSWSEWNWSESVGLVERVRGSEPNWSRVRAGGGGIGQRDQVWSSVWAPARGTVKCVCRIKEKWSRVCAVVSGIGQECLLEQARTVKCLLE